MRKSIHLIGLALLFAASQGLGQTISYPPQLAAFTDAKEQQEQRLARELHVPLPPEVKDFFKSAHAEDYLTLSNMVARCGAQLFAGYSSFTNGEPAWLPFWQPMTEVDSAYEIFALGGTKYLLAFGEGIIKSIPAGSIYFGGTDSGRMLVTALSQSHAEGKPFYTLTQNALADDHYMTYLREMYGQKIKLPSANEMSQVFDEYKTDALLRLKHDEQFPGEPRQIAPGEEVREVNGELKFAGQVAVMAMNGRLLKWILDNNPGPEFYYEESFPLEMIYSRLEPHDLIFKLNHEPLPALSAAVMDTDHAIWSKQFTMLLGDWLKTGTSLSHVCLNVETVYREKDLSSFTGDREFLTNDFAAKAFSKLRVSIAGLYQWRLMKGTGADDASRLRLEADYAFQQAYVMCPTSPEVVFRYVNFLTAQGRINDAILLVHTTLTLTPADDHFYDQYENMIMQLKRFREQAGAAENRR